MLDVVGHRFARLPRDWPLDLIPSPAAWVPYSRLLLDPDEPMFTILAPDHYHPLVRDVVHLEPCGYCRGHNPYNRRAACPPPPTVLVWRDASPEA
jgi:hypothetical protein